MNTSTDSRRLYRRWSYLVLAYGCVGLAAAGVVLPGLPTTPFLLVAAWASSRGSERLHRWLYGHRHFGPLLKNWDEQRAVSMRAKLTAIILLCISWAIIAVRADSHWLPAMLGVFFLLVATFLITRPTPRP